MIGVRRNMQRAFPYSFNDDDASYPPPLGAVMANSTHYTESLVAPSDGTSSLFHSSITYVADGSCLVEELLMYGLVPFILIAWAEGLRLIDPASSFGLSPSPWELRRFNQEHKGDIDEQQERWKSLVDRSRLSGIHCSSSRRRHAVHYKSRGGPLC